MARTVPAWANRVAPEMLRFISGLPIRADDWADAGSALNLTHATGAHGAQWSQVLKGTGLTGTLAVGTHLMRVTLPVPDDDLARLRLRVWGQSAAGTAGNVEMYGATTGPVAATTGASLTRYASAALDVTADVQADAAAGPWVTVTLRARDAFTALHSVHVDSLERGWGTYPGASTTLPAGVSGGVIPVDDGETVQDSPLSADVLFDMRESVNALATRRKVRACWGDWYDIVTGTSPQYRPSGGLAPQRIPVMLPIAQGGTMSLTLAASVFDAPSAARSVWLCTLTPDGSIESVIAEWSLSTTGVHVQTVDIPTERVRRRYDDQRPEAGLDAHLRCALIVEGAVPQRDRLRLQGVRTTEADDEIIAGGWGIDSLTLWGPR